ncbi:hypothetical protein OAN61_00975, partial [bacterium]|nr:hypothetical protein [bacterium]
MHEHNSLVQNFDAALADRTDRYVREANLGLGRVQILPQTLSPHHLHAQSAYAMDKNSFVADWRPREQANPAGLLPSPPTQAGLRQLLFNCDMREDDRARLLKSMVKPDVWLNAPTLGAADLAVLGPTRANQDKSLREQQESKLKQVAPLLGAISAGGSLLSAAASITDAQEREAVQVGAKRTIEHISGCLNLLAFDISALQVKRRTLALRAYSAVSGLTIEPTQRSSDWSLVP